MVTITRARKRKEAIAALLAGKSLDNGSRLCVEVTEAKIKLPREILVKIAECLPDREQQNNFRATSWACVMATTTMVKCGSGKLLWPSKEIPPGTSPDRLWRGDVVWKVASSPDKTRAAIHRRGANGRVYLEVWDVRQGLIGQFDMPFVRSSDQQMLNLAFSGDNTSLASALITPAFRAGDWPTTLHVWTLPPSRLRDGHLHPNNIQDVALDGAKVGIFY